MPIACTIEKHEAMTKSPDFDRLPYVGLTMSPDSHRRPSVGYRPTNDEPGYPTHLEMRNCACGSTLCKPIYKREHMVLGEAA